jgi:hypothetical protein
VVSGASRIGEQRKGNGRRQSGDSLEIKIDGRTIQGLEALRGKIFSSEGVAG